MEAGREGGCARNLTLQKVTWLLENERQHSANQTPIRLGLGWWGRGFIEGAVYIIGDKAVTAANGFGLSVDVVPAHLATYCYAHQSETPYDGIQELLLKVVKAAQ